MTEQERRDQLLRREGYAARIREFGNSPSEQRYAQAQAAARYPITRTVPRTVVQGLVKYKVVDGVLFSCWKESNWVDSGHTRAGIALAITANTQLLDLFDHPTEEVSE